MTAGCYACTHGGPDAPMRERAIRTGHWRVAHADRTALPGWSILLPLRHVTSLDELTPQEAAELGPLLTSLTAALREVTGCVKTYLMQFSEAEGFSHLHLHLVPRMPDHPEDALGPGVFVYLREDRAEWLPEQRRDDIALSIRRALP